MTAASLPPGTVERYTFATAWEDGPWILAVDRWPDATPAAEAAAKWIVDAAKAGHMPRVRVQTVRELGRG